ncbi:ABC transporter ATP-binding protein [uncultured Roseibium sp.]|uniref:ABC transporter ATP-binding protein n=1 Tax=uncultured Roseibium sp. TaxID=1936171 RepID=UPI0026033BA1|nr:ABC transporter ATP-binding protein [uncultured Roseibium sp.]
MTEQLSVEGLTAGYGGPPIIEEISLSVEPAEIAVILGPNGAGKSTLLKSIFALTHVAAGSIRLGERELIGCKTSALVPLGVSAVPQSKNVFPSMTVAENLDVGTYAAPPHDKKATLGKVLALFPDLNGKLGQPAGELSGGQRQMVAMGRALMSDPKLVLLDEPTAGLSPAYLERIFDLLLDIRKTGITILMVEQNARQALQIADHGHILVNGRNHISGTGQELLADEDVRRLFLGGAAG